MIPWGTSCSSLLLEVWNGKVGVFLKSCNLWAGPRVEQFMQDCLLWEALHTGEGERSPIPVEEEAAKTACDELTTAPISQLPLPLRLSKSGLRLSLGRREG